MKDILKEKPAAIICSAIFCVSIILTALTCNLIVSDTHYATLTPDYGSLSLYDGAEQLVSSAFSTASQMMIVFVAGFTFFAAPVAAVVSAYRGISFGYAVSVVAQGRIKFSGNENLSVFGLTEIPVFAIVLFMYLLSSILMLFFMNLSVSFSERLKKSQTVDEAPVKKYILLFCVLSGACSLCDIIKSLII